jgi:hypothetical protein
MITGPTGASDRAQAAAWVLAWRQGVEASLRDQTDRLNAMGGEPPENDWFTEYVEGVQERWPKFLDSVGRTADGVGAAIGDYFEGVGERWDQLVDRRGP